MDSVKKRLDSILVEKGFFKSRERAKRSVMAGVVFVNGIREDKPGARFGEEISIEVKKDINPYVSRGGLKLAKAIEEFKISLEGVRVLDIGASTGGFTDCMLKNGAEHVIAIDVGYGQIAWELRKDPRVTVLDRTNIRYIKPSDIEYMADFASIDVSFISLKLVIPVVSDLLKDDGEMVCLIKPQFEAGRKHVGKKGIVRELETHIRVVRDMLMFTTECDLMVKGLTFSPIKGSKGNIEYLLHLSKTHN